MYSTCNSLAITNLFWTHDSSGKDSTSRPLIFEQMSTAGHSSSVARSPLGPSTSNGNQTKPGALVPTNNVTTGDGLTVRTRIDPTLTVDDVMKQLCLNLKIKEPPAHFALRDETDELVTNDNLRKKIRNKVNLK